MSISPSPPCATPTSCSPSTWGHGCSRQCASPPQPVVPLATLQQLWVCLGVEPEMVDTLLDLGLFWSEGQLW
eukprot:15485686-Alexandrium_andersonii.AAC.1